MELIRQLIPRRERRINISVQATLICAGTKVPVHLIDLSRDGALAHAKLPPATNAIVWLLSRGVEMPARIAWARGDRLGLSFSRSLSDLQFRALANPN
jgi:hypothetical protein